MRGWLRAREIGKRIQCDVCAIKLSRTRILMHKCRLDQTMLGSFFRNAKFLLEEISKPLRCNSPQFFRARAGSYHRFPMRHCLRARVRAAQDPRFPYEAVAAPNQSLGRLEPAARSAPRAARKRWKSRPKEDLAPAYIRPLS